eukprot:1160075-Pelagomonas_calceolata.AAC.8
MTGLDSKVKSVGEKGHTWHEPWMKGGDHTWRAGFSILQRKPWFGDKFWIPMMRFKANRAAF